MPFHTFFKISSLGFSSSPSRASESIPGNPTVHYLVDNEGPSDRFYITNFNDPGFLRVFDNHTTDDVDWCRERESYLSIRTYPGRYLKVQTELDHVHREDKGHALMMIENATNTSYGGLGTCSLTRMNGSENTPNTVFTQSSLPAWLPAGSSMSRGMDFVKEEGSERHG